MMATAEEKAAALYDRCVETGRALVDGSDPTLTQLVDFSKGQAFAIEHGDAVDWGIFIGVTAAMIRLRKEGYLDD